MEFIQENYNDDILEDAFPQKSLPSELTDEFDDPRDPELLPRVGDKYQVEIPQLISESKQRKAKIDRAITGDISMGLPISLMWVNDGVGDSNDSKIKHEPLDDAQIRGFPEGTNLKTPKIEPLDFQESSNVTLLQEVIKRRGKGYRLVPGHVGGTWSEIEKDGFLLGLYIFGKNLASVKRLVGSKRMGEILSFYYGKFYGSGKYRRWSECRKLRSRRAIFGQKIFTGARQQELLSRLRPHLSEECQCALMEDSKAFTLGKLSLEEYVFSLRDRVGLKALVEAIGIGKGKQDLTITMVDPAKSNQMAQTHPEIPTGKACSSLELSEIIRFLTGGYRLSKAKSNDLFWEAVWPRLLARGWHSEQPNNVKHALVFLVPGVKKFSRRKLVKGNHYFDSVSDVLSKVANDPKLLVLENDSDEMKTDQGSNNDDDHQQRFYLKPKSSNGGLEFMKFTIVDTSLANGVVRELRSLPIDTRASQAGARDPSTDESDASDSFSSGRVECNVSPNNCALKGAFLVGGLNKSNTCRKLKPRKNNNCVGPVVEKRRRLSACNNRTATTTIRSQPENSSPPLDLSHERLPSASNSNKQEEPPPSPQRAEIDLNIPLPIDSKTGNILMQESTERQEPQPGSSDNNNVKPLRQSMRNRPLTAKALEALAFGYINPPNPKHKRKEDFPKGNSNNNNSKTRRLSHRALSRVRVTENVNAGAAVSELQGEEGGSCHCRKEDDGFSNLQV